MSCPTGISAISRTFPWRGGLDRIRLLAESIRPSPDGVSEEVSHYSGWFVDNDLVLLLLPSYSQWAAANDPRKSEWFSSFRGPGVTISRIRTADRRKGRRSD